MDLLSLISSVDMFGVEYSISIFSKKEYKSIYGSVLTIILLALAIYKIVVLISQTINKTNFTVVEEKDTLSGEVQNLTDYFVTFCVHQTDKDSFRFDEIMSSASDKALAGVYNETMSEQTDYYCISYDLSNWTLSAGKVESGVTKDTEYFTLGIWSFPLELTTDALYLYIDEVFIKRTDYYNPVHHKNFVINMIASTSQIASLYLQSVDVTYKNSYNFGFFKYEPTSTKRYTSYHSNTLSVSSLQSETLTNVLMAIYHSDWVTTYIFSGFDLDTVLSDFGGYLNTCFVVLSFIGTFINNYLLQNYVSTNLNRKITDDDDLLEIKVGEDSIKNYDTNKNFNIGISSETQNLNLGRKRNDIADSNKRRLVKNTTRSNEVDCLNLESNQISNEEQNDSKLIIGANKKRVINSNPIEEQIEERDENDNEMFKLYKYECDEICAKINSEDELYNQLYSKEISDSEKEKIKVKINDKLFEERMDFSYFYIIFKELKILELLLLKSDSIGPFFEYNKHTLDFNKLTALVENKQTRNKLFSSRLYKEYALQKCII